MRQNYFDWELFKYLDRTCTWSVRFHTIVDTRRPVATFKPGRIVVKPFGSGDPTVFWRLGDDTLRPPRDRRPQGDDGDSDDEESEHNDEDDGEHTLCDEDDAEEDGEQGANEASR